MASSAGGLALLMTSHSVNASSPKRAGRDKLETRNWKLEKRKAC